MKKKPPTKLHCKEFWFSSQKLVKIQQRKQPIVKPVTSTTLRRFQVQHLLKSWEFRGGVRCIGMNKTINPHYLEERWFSEGVTCFWLNGDSSVRLQVATALS